MVSTTARAFGCQVRVFREVSFPRLELSTRRSLSFKFRITFFSFFLRPDLFVSDDKFECYLS